MATVQFDRDQMARWYARQHRQIDPGIVQVHYLLTGSPDQEIRFLEINHLLGEMNDEALEAVDFGVDTGADQEHKLVVMDVTPAQWAAITHQRLALPTGWSLDGEQGLGTRQP